MQNHNIYCTKSRVLGFHGVEDPANINKAKLSQRLVPDALSDDLALRGV